MTPQGKRGPLGIEITEHERAAPKGMYRVVMADIGPNPPQFYFVSDEPDYRTAVRVAKQAANGGDHLIGYAIHDDTGKAINLPVPSGFLQFAERVRQLGA